MTPRDYREAWAWVHLLLNGPEPGKSILMSYLAQTDRAETASRLRPRLAEAKIDEARLVQYLKGLQSGPVASAAPRETRRGPIPGPAGRAGTPGPAARPPARLGSWLGI